MSLYQGQTSMTTGIETEVSTIGGINKHQSTGNLFSEIQSEAGGGVFDDQQTRDTSLRIPHTVQQTKLQPYDSKVELTNASTLRPYLRMQKHFELVPIFYKRNPKKTRNSLAQSIHSIHYINEMNLKKN